MCIDLIEILSCTRQTQKMKKRNRENDVSVRKILNR